MCGNGNKPNLPIGVRTPGVAHVGAPTIGGFAHDMEPRLHICFI
jgi:hypothetical protein